eukprot:1157403-Pelagomonas_calceolata.AAC.5
MRTLGGRSLTFSGGVLQTLMRRREAAADAAAEPLLSSFLYASILAHDRSVTCAVLCLYTKKCNAFAKESGKVFRR